MAGIPYHHILVLDEFAVEKVVDVSYRLRRICGKALPVVDLSAVVTKNPHISHAVAIGSAVVYARNQLIPFASRRVCDAPFPLPRAVSQSPNLISFPMPIRWREKRRIVKLFDKVISGGANVEVKSPVRMVVV